MRTYSLTKAKEILAWAILISHKLYSELSLNLCLCFSLIPRWRERPARVHNLNPLLDLILSLNPRAGRSRQLGGILI